MQPVPILAGTPRRPGLSAVFAVPGYRRFWAARTISQAGDVAQFTTLALLVLHLTGSGTGVSGAVLAEIAAVLLVAPLAGPIVDRLPRIPVMLAADAGRLLLAAGLAVWHSDLATVYAVAFGLSAGAVFFNPAAGSLLPTLVPAEDLVAANSGIWSTAVLVQVLLAPAAGLLAATAGYGWAFAANAVSFGLSAVLLRGLGNRQTPQPVQHGTMWSQTRQAWRLLGQDRLLRAVATAQALAALSAGATSALLVLLAADRLHAGGAGYGLLLAAIGLGAATGPLLLTRLPTRSQGPKLIFAAFGLRGLVDLTLATVTVLPAALAALLLYGLGTSSGNVTFATTIQTHVRPETRGRIFSAFDLIWHTLRLVSLLAGGILADTLGVQVVYYLGGLLLLGAALAGVAIAGRSRGTTSSAA